MNYLISLDIGLLVGLLCAILSFRSPVPPTIALIGLLDVQLGEQLFPFSRDLLQQWLHWSPRQHGAPDESTTVRPYRRPRRSRTGGHARPASHRR